MAEQVYNGFGSVLRRTINVIVIKVKTCFELIYKRIKRRYNIETW